MSKHKFNDKAKTQAERTAVTDVDHCPYPVFLNTGKSRIKYHLGEIDTVEENPHSKGCIVNFVDRSKKLFKDKPEDVRGRIFEAAQLTQMREISDSEDRRTDNALSESYARGYAREWSQV